MRTNVSIVVAAYVRLSVDEAGKSVSGSIENQISLIKEYCAKRELIVAAVFQDDGWSGGNFERPGFKKLLEFLRKKSANTVITVDLSRLGRNMREASYYAEEYFPEHGIHFFTISDGFDTARENVFAPFQFAMNEVYLRDGSRKVKNVLKNKRESGQFCACPPYGYKKNPDNVHQLIPDEVTALAEDYDIAVRAGAHCAPRMHGALGTVEQGAVRFSFGYYNTEEETDAAIAAVRELAEQ